MTKKGISKLIKFQKTHFSNQVYLGGHFCILSAVNLTKTVEITKIFPMIVALPYGMKIYVTSYIREVEVDFLNGYLPPDLKSILYDYLSTVQKKI